MAPLETILAYGHKNILGTHKTTIEITKDEFLTRRGDCIIGIKANKACFDLNPKLKGILKEGKRIKVSIEVENLSESFYGYGHKKLKLTHKHDLVFRTSSYICDRTVLINCTKSSRELSKIQRVMVLIICPSHLAVKSRSHRGLLSPSMSKYQWCFH